MLMFDIPGLVSLFFVCAPLVLCIANIMLANNICDLEVDLSSRYTMARHIGRQNALRLFAALYVFVYIAVVAACILRILPLTCLFILATSPVVYRNVKQFQAKQVKTETFILAIKNFLVILVPYALCILLGAMLQGL